MHNDRILLVKYVILECLVITLLCNVITLVTLKVAYLSQLQFYFSVNMLAVVFHKSFTSLETT